MELAEINVSIDTLRKLHASKLLSKYGSATFANSLCTIDEVSDVFGFSLIHDDLGESCNSSSKYFDERRNSLRHSIIDRFQSDDNWSNPKAVDLMCKSYGIDNINQYDSLIVSSSSMDGNNSGDVSTNNNKWTYLTIKLEQNQMFASNLYAEGVALMNTMKYDEAVKKFTDAIHYNDKFVDAYIQRAHAYELLSMPQVALDDYSKVKEIRTMNITVNGSRFDKLMSSSTNKLTNNADLITKLQYSIYQDTTSAGNQKHPSQSIGSMVHTSGGGGGRSQATVKANILSPDGSSTAGSDSSYDEVNCATGSLRHKGDDDELSNSKKKQKRKRDKHKKSKKKKHKKHKKSSD